MDSQTATYGIFGNPVEHSLSPFLHNTLFDAYKINAVYLAFCVEINSLALAFEGIRSLGIRGVNLTIPFKEDALNYIDEIPEDLDRRIGAINTVVNKEGYLFGYNTDNLGFLTALREELSFNPEGKSILVLGAGGAARGIAFALAYARAERLWIYNRTMERAEGLAEHLTTHFPATEIKALDTFESLQGEKLDLVVNATSLGLNKNDPAPFDFNILKTKASVYDLVYNPLETPFLKEARRRELPAAGGLGMLAAQAALSFTLWTGKTDGVREKMLEAIKSCSF